MPANDRRPDVPPHGSGQPSEDPYDPERAVRDARAAEEARRTAFRPPHASKRSKGI